MDNNDNLVGKIMIDNNALENEIKSLDKQSIACLRSLWESYFEGPVNSPAKSRPPCSENMLKQHLQGGYNNGKEKKQKVYIII